MEPDRASRTRALRPAFALASGLLYAASQPDRGAWPLAFVSLVPLLHGLRGVSVWRRFVLGGVMGATAGCALVLHPVSVAIARYFELAVAPSLAFALVLVLLFGAIPFALFAGLVGDPERGAPWTLLPRVGSAIVVCEFVRSNLLGGLPWGLLGHCLAPVPALAQGAALFGTAGVSFAIAAFSGAGVALYRSHRSGPVWLALCVALLALLLPGTLMPHADGGGIAPAAPGAGREPGSVRVALIQGAFPGAGRGDPARVRGDLARLLELDADAETQLSVWPESAISVVLPANLELVARAVRGKQPRSRWILAGAPRSDRASPGPPMNSAVLLDPAGRLVAHHDKVQLVPIAEARFWPLGGRNRHQRGAALRPLEVHGLRPGVLVCYEILFSGLARELTRQGADVLINISNDEWFGGTRGLEQHFSAAVLRAIELRRPILRATNTGISAGIDSAGRVRGRLAPGRPGVLHFDLRPGGSVSVYQRFGDWLLWPSLLMGALAIGLGRA